MGRTYASHVNPYNGLAESVVTSNVVHLMDAFDWSYSWYTTSGATSRVTMEVSNSGFDTHNISSIPEASWSRWTVFGHTAPPSASGASIEFPPLGVRYARYRRWVGSSAGSVTIDVNKLVNG